MISIQTIVVSAFQQNARILYKQNRAVIVDPGDEAEIFIQFLKSKDLICEAIIITHSHIDHIGALSDLLKLLQEYQENPVCTYAHRDGRMMRENIELLASHYGLSGPKNAPEPTYFLEDGDTVVLLDHSFDVSFTPGHSPDHLVFYLKAGIPKKLIEDFSSEETLDPILIAGDCVFKASIGRTDLPGGDHNLLLKSIQDKIMCLPDNTRILPGHGPSSQIYIERSGNPFLVN